MEDKNPKPGSREADIAESVSKIAWHLVARKYRYISVAVAAGAVALAFLDLRLSLAVVLVFFGIMSAKAGKFFMRYFAEANGLKYEEYARVDSATGRLFKLGHGQDISNVIHGDFSGRPMRLFNFNYTTGSSKHVRRHPFTVLEVDFEKTVFPYILLQSRMMSKHEATDSWGNDKDRTIPLEEVFQKSFSLYVTQGNETEALQIFTPGTLGFLVQNSADFSIEFAEDKMYIYDDKNISNRKELQKLYDVAWKIFELLGPLLNRLHDDFSALHPYYKDGK